ncbi:MAG: hypothetical protein NVV59_16750 [Chitinophagaceae bacterium]|nr:hypothetical protein [Chitinophagaceae bacterium]
MQHVYLYQTKVGGAEYSLLKQILPQAKIDTGGYIVPTFETDTTELKY